MFSANGLPAKCVFSPKNGPVPERTRFPHHHLSAGAAMSMFEDNRYRWRETYFVLFDAKKRPQLKAVSKAIAALSSRYELINLNANEHGQIDSLTLISPDDFAALDVCYTGGEEVQEQVVETVKELKKSAADIPPPVPWDQIQQYDGRFDVLHFEQVPEEIDDEFEDDAMLDPSALLLVLNTLARLTGGVAVDPQAGVILLEED
jgi:hypothetical protein